MKTAIWTGLAAILTLGSLAMRTASAQAANPGLSAGEQWYNHEFRDADWKKDYTGEQFCWGASYSVGGVVEGYRLSKDASYLDFAVKYYDALLAKMAQGPDGYKGWIGPYVYDNNYWCDVHVGDALLFGAMMDFAHLVTSDPALKDKYGAKAMEYVDSAKKNLFDKWDARGTWHEDGPFGFYRSWDKFGMPGQLTDWKVIPGLQLGDNSLPFNKQMDVAVVAMRIWQVTGDEKYKNRAEQIFGYFKSHMQRYKDEYHWNYWEPAAPFDIVSDKPGNQLFQWVGVHGERNYQSGEVFNIVKAYNAGIVFTEQDIEGILNTNLKQMWNGNEQNPRWANSNADLNGPMKPSDYHGPNDKDSRGDSYAGEAWEALAPFSAEIRLLVGSHMEAGLGRDYFQNVTCKTLPSFHRTDVTGPVTIPPVYAQFPMGNVRTVTVGVALPSVFVCGQKTMLVCKLCQTENLEVAIYSADGKTKLASLHQGRERGGPSGREGIFLLPFTGIDPTSGKTFEPGDYRVRWTVPGDGYREFPITIQAAKP